MVGADEILEKLDADELAGSDEMLLLRNDLNGLQSMGLAWIILHKDHPVAGSDRTEKLLTLLCKDPFFSDGTLSAYRLQ